MKRLNLALDFDGTFTEDPSLWGWLAATAGRRGHQVYCVTSRNNSPENEKEILDSFSRFGARSIRIIFCNSDLKMRCVENLGVRIDIWIDDSPYALIRGY